MRVAVLVLAAVLALAAADTSATSSAPPAHRFDERAAFAFLKRQVELGPRPAGSGASRSLAALLRASVPHGAYRTVPGGLRNVTGYVAGRDPRRVVIVGAHYDTKDLPGFVGANDGASGTAVVRQLARSIRPRQVRPTVVFMFFDGEESPADAPVGAPFATTGLRGSRAAAAHPPRGAEAMLLLDMVGDRELSIPREPLSNARLWARLRAAAGRAGFASAFPAGVAPSGIVDDHVPFRDAGIAAVDAIDFSFPCWHQACDDLSAVSPRSLDAVGETVLELLRRL